MPGGGPAGPRHLSTARTQTLRCVRAPIPFRSCARRGPSPPELARAVTGRSLGVLPGGGGALLAVPPPPLHRSTRRRRGGAGVERRLGPTAASHHASTGAPRAGAAVTGGPREGNPGAACRWASGTGAPTPRGARPAAVACAPPAGPRAGSRPSTAVRPSAAHKPASARGAGAGGALRAPRRVQARPVQAVGSRLAPRPAVLGVRSRLHAGGAPTAGAVRARRGGPRPQPSRPGPVQPAVSRRPGALLALSLAPGLHRGQGQATGARQGPTHWPEGRPPRPRAAPPGSARAAVRPAGGARAAWAACRTWRPGGPEGGAAGAREPAGPTQRCPKRAASAGHGWSREGRVPTTRTRGRVAGRRAGTRSGGRQGVSRSARRGERVDAPPDRTWRSPPCAQVGASAR